MCARSVGGTPASSASGGHVSSTAPRTLGERAVGEPVVEQVAHEQRVAARALRECLREAVRQRRRTGTGTARWSRDGRGRQPPDAQLLAEPAHGEVVRELDDRRLALGAVRAEQQQPGRLAPAQQRGDQVERGVVGPVQVLEHKHDRRRAADRVERLEHLAQHARAGRSLGALAHRLGGRAFAEQPRQLDEPGRGALGQRGDDRLAGGAARQRTERLEHGHVGLARPALGQALADARDGAARRVAQERVDERALAGARLACTRARRHAVPTIARPSAARSRASSGSRPAGAGAGAAESSGVLGAASVASCSRIRRSSSRVAAPGARPSSSSRAARSR